MVYGAETSRCLPVGWGDTLESQSPRREGVCSQLFAMGLHGTLGKGSFKNPVKMPGPPLSARQILSEGRKVDRATIEGNPLEALQTFGLREG